MSRGAYPVLDVSEHPVRVGPGEAPPLLVERGDIRPRTIVKRVRDPMAPVSREPTACQLSEFSRPGDIWDW